MLLYFPSKCTHHLRLPRTQANIFGTGLLLPMGNLADAKHFIQPSQLICLNLHFTLQVLGQCSVQKAVNRKQPKYNTPG